MSEEEDLVNSTSSSDDDEYDQRMWSECSDDSITFRLVKKFLTPENVNRAQFGYTRLVMCQHDDERVSNAKILHYFVKMGYNVNLVASIDDALGPERYGLFCSAIHYAVCFSLGTKYMNLLLDYGADPNLKDPNGDTPLDYLAVTLSGAVVHACYENSCALARLLIYRGAMRNPGTKYPLEILEVFSDISKCRQTVLAVYMTWKRGVLVGVNRDCVGIIMGMIWEDRCGDIPEMITWVAKRKKPRY